jgi:hypothetical protein
MKMSVRSWIVVCVLGSLMGLGCGAAQEEPKQILGPEAAPIIDPAPAPAATTGRAPGVSANTITEPEPPPIGLVAPARPLACWADADGDGLRCRLENGQCCSFTSDRALVACGSCESE